MCSELKCKRNNLCKTTRRPPIPQFAARKCIGFRQFLHFFVPPPSEIFSESNRTAMFAVVAVKRNSIPALPMKSLTFANSRISRKKETRVTYYQICAVVPLSCLWLSTTRTLRNTIQVISRYTWPSPQTTSPKFARSRSEYTVLLVSTWEMLKILMSRIHDVNGICLTFRYESTGGAGTGPGRKHRIPHAY